jgi:sensor histidine kinase YesM
MYRKSVRKPDSVIELLSNSRYRFWLTQLLFWFTYAVASGLVKLTYTHHGYDGPGTSIIVIHSTLGLLISSAMGLFYRSISLRQPGRIVSLAVVASIGSAFAWTLTHNWIYSMLDPVRWQDAHISIYLVGILNAGFILLCWTAGYFSIRYYNQAVSQRQAMSELKIQAQQAKLRMLRYQVNPHFMFNTLASISALIRDGKNEAADLMLERMGDLLRLTLKSNPDDMVTVEEELRTLDMYVQIEKVRFEDRLRYLCEWDRASSEMLVPSLILQPLVENSIKHAISCAEDGGDIRLSLSVEGNRLLIELADSGGAHERSQSAGGTKVGLKNVQQRLKNLYGEDHEFHVSAMEPAGFTVMMNLPAYNPNSQFA